MSWMYIPQSIGFSRHNISSLYFGVNIYHLLCIDEMYQVIIYIYINFEEVVNILSDGRGFCVNCREESVRGFVRVIVFVLSTLQRRGFLFGCFSCGSFCF